MPIKPALIAALVLIVGLVTGTIFAAGFQTDGEANTVATFILTIFCDAEGTGFSCGFVFPILLLITPVLGFVVVAIEYHRGHGWVHGLIIFTVGWVLGNLYVFLKL